MKESCNDDYKQQVATGLHLSCVLYAYVSVSVAFFSHLLKNEIYSDPSEFFYILTEVWWKHYILDQIVPAYILNPGKNSAFMV